jgi:hypothetical protein
MQSPRTILAWTGRRRFTRERVQLAIACVICGGFWLLVYHVVSGVTP